MKSFISERIGLLKHLSVPQIFPYPPFSPLSTFPPLQALTAIM